jgi:Pyrroline-5-carboxylate reductase dimerisation
MVRQWHSDYAPSYGSQCYQTGGVRVGLHRDIATKLAAQTCKGAAEMVLATGRNPADLKDQGRLENMNESLFLGAPSHETMISLILLLLSSLFGKRHHDRWSGRAGEWVSGGARIITFATTNIDRLTLVDVQWISRGRDQCGQGGNKTQPSARWENGTSHRKSVQFVNGKSIIRLVVSYRVSRSRFKAEFDTTCTRLSPNALLRPSAAPQWYP